jgi:glycosidase
MILPRIFGLAVPLAVVGLGLVARGQPVVDGTLNGSEGYGSPLAVQTINTGFGDNSNGSGLATGSELDAVYGFIANGKLNLFIAGNVQGNGNNIDVLIADGRAGGQPALAINAPAPQAAMNGSSFSPGFVPNFLFTFTNSADTLSVDEAALSAGSGTLSHVGNVALSGGTGNAQDLGAGGLAVGFNNLNTGGVSGVSGTIADPVAAGAVATGLELAIPLSALGNPTGSVQVLVFLNGRDFVYLSNQFLPGLPGGTGNLGAGGNFGPGGGVFNFTSTPGEFVTIPNPASGPTTPVLTVDGMNADYGTEHIFIDEVSHDLVPLVISFSPNASNVIEADVFSNLNRRDRATFDANGDGIEDGIVPPDGNTIATGDTNNYYEAYAMTPVGGSGQYGLTLLAQQTGVYRLTARFKVAGGTNWIWYSTNAPYSTGNRRDFSIVVSPKKAQAMAIYELAVNNVGAQGTATDGSQRSTFADLYNGPGSRPFDPVYNRFNLNYVTNLGANWLWLEPIFPRGIAGSINSPYCVKNIFSASAWMGKADTRPAALQEFQGFVAAADAAGVNVMLDLPINHTAHDVELADEGVADFGGAGNPGNWQPTDLIASRMPEFFSATNAYCSRATSASTVAVAPDRGDFAKWGDVSDVFYGVYAALVCQNPADNSSYLNSSDWFDYRPASGSFDPITRNVWRYYSDSILFWLNQTGCTNGTPANATAVGVDGIRADFAEGMPPQFWEYTINKVRSQKWDFVFLAESLGGGATTYRSSRDFDVLNDGVYNSFRTAASAADYQNIFDSERASYGRSLMMWNSTSHDVGGYFSDPFSALIRYLVGSTIDGAPYILYGQELGTANGTGFSLYSTNGTELVPNIFVFNSLQPAITAGIGNFRTGLLYPLFGAAGQARQMSPALQSANRYFLDSTVPQTNIYAVGKFAMTNASPNDSDVVFAFVNLDLANAHQGNFNVNLTANDANVFGIKPARRYNVKNLAAYRSADANRPNTWLWATNGIAGSNLLANGVNVSLNPVPTGPAGWTNSPYEAQYLKLYDVTPPATPVAPTTSGYYVTSNAVTFTWLPLTDPDGGVSGYQVLVGTSPGGSDVFSGVVSGTSLTVTNLYGTTLYAEVSAINNAGIVGSPSSSSAGVILVDPAWIPVVSLQDESVLKWSSISGKTYQVWSTTNLSVPFTPVGGTITAWGATVLSTNAPTAPARFFRVQVIP